MSLRAGLCSVTFRQRAADEVIGLAVDAGLAGIEWGADVHVPPGDLDLARGIARRCADVGLATLSYGSYLVAGRSKQPHTAVFDTASALGAATVRVWAGHLGPDAASQADRQRIAGHLAAMVDAAACHDLTIATEFHPGTLTESASSALELFDDVADDRLRTYWQPRGGQAPATALDQLHAVSARLQHLHVFWWDLAGTRLPLTDGESMWQPALAAARPVPGDGLDRFAYLEFVVDDSPEAFRRDAATLLAILGTG